MMASEESSDSKLKSLLDNPLNCQVLVAIKVLGVKDYGPLEIRIS